MTSEFFVSQDGMLSKNSLNFFAKKKEAERIDKENTKMASRLLSQNATLDLQQWEDDNKKNEKIK